MVKLLSGYCNLQRLQLILSRQSQNRSILILRKTDHTRFLEILTSRSSYRIPERIGYSNTLLNLSFAGLFLP